ncbi:hypothetical protein [Legionella saoudiensis]|uniref:hypothetical protein n=1 Tax=Legionella saoudiensis TaxID=1750561 RepID=UPI0007302A0A|nr:hypothetical protein [Legionella saoudiensis]
MNQRLIWNFEFTSQTASLPAEFLIKQEPEELKWEIRFFWPNDEIIVLNTLDNSLLDIAKYQQKSREDYYYLLTDSNYNIKRRRNELLYKPLLKRTDQAIAFGSKINLDDLKDPTADPQLQKIAQHVAQQGVEVYVKKVAFIYKFATTPTVKLELARLEVQNQTYLSACIEGKSLFLVERLAGLLLGKQNSCEYVTFLKNILHL